MLFIPSNRFVAAMLLLLTPLSLTTPYGVADAYKIGDLAQKFHRALTQKIYRDLTQKIRRDLSKAASPAWMWRSSAFNKRYLEGDADACDPATLYGSDVNTLLLHSSEYEPVCNCSDSNSFADFEMNNPTPNSNSTVEEFQAWLDSFNAALNIEGVVEPNFRTAKGCTNDCSFCFGSGTNARGTYCGLFRQESFLGMLMGLKSNITLDDFIAFGEQELVERFLVYEATNVYSRCLDVLENSLNGALGEICFLQNTLFQSDDGVTSEAVEKAVLSGAEVSCSVLYKGENCKLCSINSTTACISLDCTNLLADSNLEICNETAVEDFPGLFRPLYHKSSELTLGTCNLTNLAPTPVAGAPADTTATSSGSVCGPWMIAMTGSLLWCLVSLMIG